MQKHEESHLDHGLDERQVAYLFDLFRDRTGFFIETIELPEELGFVPCGLYGPIMGDAPVSDFDDDVTLGMRGERKYTSRLVTRPKRPTRKVSIIAGPLNEECTSCTPRLRATGDDGETVCVHCKGTSNISHACILYTAFGGPVTPQEPGDPRINSTEAMTASVKFWGEHGLAKDETVRELGATP